MARLSASSKETFFIKKDQNVTMWLDFLKFRGNFFDEERLKLNHVARLSASSEEKFLMRKD